jgi:LacI family repressor for deo operon, udp, cdd, tsx, nupC, and nupG
MTGPPRLTSKDIARHAGVSQTTVSLVMRGAAAGKVSPATQERVREVARSLGYRPSQSARGLRSGRSLIVGLVIPDVLDPFFGGVLRGAQQLAAERGYTVAMIESTSDATTAEAVAAVQASRLDGLVLHSPNRADLRQGRRLAERVVVVDAGAPRSLSWIRYDVAEGVRLTLDHLTRLGHRRVGHVSAVSERVTFTDRATEIERLAGDRLVAAVDVPFAFEAGVERITPFLAEHRGRLTALVCDTDTLAAVALRAAHALGIDVPGRLSVTAFNETPLAQALDLTTVALPAAAGGRLATGMLLNHLDDGGREHHVLPASLVVRGTSAVPYRRR